MSDSIVERVARAIAKADARAYEDAPNLFRGKARAALEAIELTPIMANAAFKAMQFGDISTEEKARELFGKGFKAAIDAALNEVTG